MHFDLGRWKIVVEVGGLEGQWLPACHILFIYNFQCATLTSVTFQLVGGGTEQKKKTTRSTSKKGYTIYMEVLLFLLSKEFRSAKFIMNVQKQAATAIAARGKCTALVRSPFVPPSRPQCPNA